MINVKSTATLLLVGACMYFGLIGSNSNDSSYVRVGDLKSDQKSRSLADTTLMEFRTGHIVGGSPASGTDFPWFTHFGDGTCGAVLISGNRVLTAAHCVNNGAPSTVRVGATTQSDGTSVSVSCANTHPSYNGFVTDDLAVLKLATSVSTTPVTRNTNPSSPAEGESLTVIGLGRTSTGGPVSNSLLQLSQTYVNPTTCNSAYGGGVDGSKVLCAKATSGGACNGDSGGPMVNANKELVGIVSFGSSAGCASGIPDGYTRVSNYNDWINGELTSDACDGCNIWQLFCIQCRRARDSIVNFALSVYRGESV